MLKNAFLIFALCFVAMIDAQAQFKWGLKAGIGTSSLKPEDIANSNFKLSIKEGKFGYYGGLFASLKAGPIIIQPEVLFNSNRVDYTYKDLKNPAIVDSIKTEKFNQLDIPLLLGFKFGPLRLKAGPVAHIHLNSSSELKDIKDYDEKWRTALWGYQAGLGLNFGSRTHLDIRYEGNFSKWGSQINIANVNYQFAQTPSRILVNVGYAF